MKTPNQREEPMRTTHVSTHSGNIAPESPEIQRMRAKTADRLKEQNAKISPESMRNALKAMNLRHERQLENPDHINLNLNERSIHSVPESKRILNLQRNLEREFAEEGAPSPSLKGRAQKN